MQRLLSTAVIKLKIKRDDTAADSSFTQVQAGLFHWKLLSLLKSAVDVLDFKMKTLKELWFGDHSFGSNVKTLILEKFILSY